MSIAMVEAYIEDAERLGVKEIYFTGGEPFLHKDILKILALALAAASPYSLDIRVNLDDVDAEGNDRVRGAGSFAKVVRALTLLRARSLPPILTATEILADETKEPARGKF
jgi:MoaA/NifB/PqqE/SkfB family radical SAM enzyme